MKLKTTIFLFIFVFFACTPGQPASADTGSFEDCVKEGNIIRKSLPAQCVTKDGKVFVDTKTFLKPPPLTMQGNCKNLCGDGTCQEMVCMALGCPCPETAENCPKDCKPAK
jgi:hypothetical protein